MSEFLCVCNFPGLVGGIIPTKYARTDERSRSDSYHGNDRFQVYFVMAKLFLKSFDFKFFSLGMLLFMT